MNSSDEFHGVSNGVDGPWLSDLLKREVVLVMTLELTFKLCTLAYALPWPSPSEYLRPSAVLSTAEVLDANPPRARYMIAMRTNHVGSRWLLSLLRSHPLVSGHREWFKLYRCCLHPAFAVTQHKNLTCAANASAVHAVWDTALGQWFRQFPNGTGTVGFKNPLPLEFYDHVERRQRCAPVAAAERRAAEDAFFESLRQLGVRVICLHRANVVSRALSGKNPSAKGFTLSPTLLRSEVLGEETFRGICLRQARRLPVFWVGYEDLLFGNLQQLMARIQDFLGLEPRRLSSPTTKRSPLNHTERIANLDVLLAVGSPLLSAMLTKLDFGRTP